MERTGSISEAVDKIKCYGCGMCAVACIFGSISMVIDKDGFVMPNVNEEKCVGCGQCVEVCPAVSSTTEQIGSKHVFAVRSRNRLLQLICSSGGAAATLGLSALENGWIYVGAVWDAQYQYARHKACKNLDSLLETIGSKYVQSIPSDVPARLLFDDEQSEGVLFVGTPCQVAGIRNFLEYNLKRGNNSKKVILVDFFCHGVPSANLWNKYLKHIEDKVGDIYFLQQRFKFSDWHSSMVRAIGSKGAYIRVFDRDIFFRFYLANYGLRPTCYRCAFVNKSSADLRIGDFWGDRFSYDRMGVSIVIGITDSGVKFLEGTQNLHIEHLSNFNIEDSQGPLSEKRFTIPSRNPSFMRDLKKLSLRRLYLRYIMFTYAKRDVGKILPVPLKRFLKRLYQRMRS